MGSQERLRRFEVCDLMVARFCTKERVTQPTFWYWRRKGADIGAVPGPIWHVGWRGVAAASLSVRESWG